MASVVSRIAEVNLFTLPDGLNSDLDKLRQILAMQGPPDAVIVQANFLARRLGLAEGGSLPMANALAAIQRQRNRIPVREPVREGSY
jgi:hypothetical protein